MDKPNVLDEAEMRQEFNRLYKEIGYKGMLQVLYELIFSVQVCCEIMKENIENERN